MVLCGKRPGRAGVPGVARVLLAAACGVVMLGEPPGEGGGCWRKVYPPSGEVTVNSAGSEPPRSGVPRLWLSTGCGPGLPAPRRPGC